MKCTNPNCQYEWKPKKKDVKSCPRCRQYLTTWKEEKKCLHCDKSMKKNPKETWEYWMSGKKFCSLKCKGLAEIGIPKESNKGEKNGQWKGDDVGYGALHDYVKTYMTKPLNCEMCGKPKKLDIANISGEYKRDLRDWEYLCRKCHMEKDGRLKKTTKMLKENRRQYLKPPSLI